jgi:undecaprenyl-diphosphatase
MSLAESSLQIDKRTALLDRSYSDRNGYVADDAELDRRAGHGLALAGDGATLVADPGCFNTDSFDAAETAQGSSRFFNWLDSWEQPLVRGMMQTATFRPVRAVVSFLNWVGNGWLYLFLLAAVLGFEPTRGLMPCVAAGLSVGAAFIFYYLVKPRVARLRPCEGDPRITAWVAPLDEYSCPSGHSMTAAAVAMPLWIGLQEYQVAIAAVGVLIGWSRIASGHHYLSDVVLGTLLGFAVAAPTCAILL